MIERVEILRERLPVPFQSIGERDAGDSGSLGVWPEHLPDHLFGKDFALHLVGSIDRAENVSVRCCPCYLPMRMVINKRRTEMNIIN